MKSKYRYLLYIILIRKHLTFISIKNFNLRVGTNDCHGLKLKIYIKIRHLKVLKHNLESNYCIFSLLVVDRFSLFKSLWFLQQRKLI